MKYDVINVQFSHPSFSWANGLHAVIERTETDIRMCRLEDDGSPQLFDDGRFMVSVTSSKSTEIYPTYLKLEWNK